MVLFVAFSGFAQTATTVTTEKVGQLKKKLGKSDITSITTLSINGVMGNKDFLFLSEMQNLQELELKDIEFQGEKDYKLDFVSIGGSEVNFPNLPNLRKLTVLLRETNESQRFSRHIFDLNLSNTPNIKTLVISSIITIKTEQALHLDLLESVPYGNFIKSMSDYYAQRNDEFEEGSPFTIEEDSHYNSYDRKGDKITPINNPKIYTKVWSILRKSMANYNDYPILNDRLFPYVIHLTESQKYFLNYWDESLSQDLLSKIDELGNYAYHNYSKDTLTLPSKITTIPNFCFGASGIKTLTIPESVKTIEKYALKSSVIEKVILLSKTAPTFNCKLLDDDESLQKVDFVIPENSTEYYSVGNWKYLAVEERGERKTYSFDVEKGGTLSEYITDENAATIMDLKIRGLLYDTDLETLKKCKNLRNLDLGFVYITTSPETMKQKHQENQALASLFQNMGLTAQTDAQNKFSHGFISSSKYQQDMILGKYFETIGSIASKESLNTADVPYNSLRLDDFKHLESLVCPQYMETMEGRVSSRRFKNVVLPPRLKKLSFVFANTSIEKVKFPETLEYIGRYAFAECKSLKEIDLYGTKVKDLRWDTFEGCDNVKMVRMGEEQKAIIRFPDTKNCEYFFYGIKECGHISVNFNSTIHIPKGYRAGWSKYDNDTEYYQLIDDL